MIRLSRLADYAMVLAGNMSREPQKCHNALDLANATTLPAPTVSKILAALARSGVLVSHRGAKGGYRLARSPHEISVADIIMAVDGPIALTICLEHGDGACEVEPVCPSRRGWHRINDAIRCALGSVTLAEMFSLPPLPPPPARAESKLDAPPGLM